MRIADTGLRAIVRRRQVLLFVLAVIVPCIVLVVMAVRMARQERELAVKRLDDERQRRTAAIRESLLAVLSHARLDAIGSFEQHPHAAVRGADPQPVLVARVEHDRLVLPWDDERKADGARRALTAGAAGAAIAAGERDELIDRRFDSAAASYGSAARLATSPLQHAYAQLLHARVLAKSAERARARDLYFQLLDLPSSVADEHGVPIWEYAAERALAVAGADAVRPILEHAETEFDAAPSAAPSERYLLGGLLDGIARTAGQPEDRVRAMRLLEPVRAATRRAEQALALQAAFPLQGMDRGVRADPPNAPAWTLFGDDAWLVSVAPLRADLPSTLVAIRSRDAIQAIAPVLGRGIRDGSLQLTPTSGGSGEWLGDAFPGVRVRFAIADADDLTRKWEMQRWFSWIVVLLVVSVTGSGGYFLWRDVRREMRLAAMRAQFVSSVSHELKTPLTAIRMFAETLRMGRAADPQVADEYLDTIVNETERLTRLLNNVLEFAKMERGVTRFRFSRQPLAGVVRAAVRALSYPLAQQDFDLAVVIPTGLPDLVVDGDAIEQAVLNLLTNAMKYSGGSRRIELTVRQDAGDVVIDVTDHGVGIAADQQHRIFEKFYRAATPENHHIPGTGLGLTLVEHIVRGHGGSVRVRSEPGAGSTFSLALPVPPDAVVGAAAAVAARTAAL